MEIYKIIALAVVTALLCVYLKNVNSDFFVPVLITGGTLILLFSAKFLAHSFESINQLTSAAGIDDTIFKLIIKITAIAYLIEFAGSLIEDLGFKSLADKLSFAGKVVLFCMSIPIFEGLMRIVTAFLS